MKKLLLFIILALVLNLLNSCKKESNDDPSIDNSYRINKMVFNDSSDNSTITVSFSYEHEKLSTIDYYQSENGVVAEQIAKSDFIYSGNEVSQLFTYYIEEIFWEEINEMDYVIENDLMLEISKSRLTFSLWEEQGSKTFQYSDNRIIGDKLFYNSEQTGKTDYIYENNSLNEIKKWKLIDGVWEEKAKEKFVYENNKISYIEHFDYYSPFGWEPTQKKEYNYTGEKLDRVEFYFWDLNSNTWVYDDSYYSFTYNDDGYLIETTDTGDSFVTYEYELGKGNASAFVSPDVLLYKFPAHLGIFYMPF